MKTATSIFAATVVVLYLGLLGYLTGLPTPLPVAAYEQATPPLISTFACSDVSTLAYANAGLAALAGAKTSEVIPPIIVKAENAKLLAAALRCFVPERTP